MTIPTTEVAATDRTNRRAFLAAGGLVVMASRLASPQLVMPWIYSLIGGPVYLIGLLIPSVRVGAVLSQVTLIPILRATSKNKWTAAYSCIVLASLLAILCFAAIELSSNAATVIFFACILGAGAGIGALQLASQEVMAKTVQHKQIGPLLAMQASIGGVLTLIIASAFIIITPYPNTDMRHFAIVIIAAVVWLLAGFSFALIREQPGFTQARRSAWKEISHGITLCRKTPWFLTFFRTRALFLSVGLAMPFYSIHAASKHIGEPKNISLFVISTGLATMLSTLVWGKMLARSPRQVFVISGILAAGAGLLAILEEALPRLPLALVYALVFFCLALAVQGMAQASKTYLAIMSPSEDRPFFIGANNILLGAFGIVFSGFLGVLAHMTHILAPLVVLIILSITAAVSALALESEPN